MPARTMLRSWRIPGAKVAVPPLPGIFVPRPRLRAILDDAAGRPVTVVRAPAGAGKTALLADWARDARDVAWVSLDRDDNDERRFWAAVLCALRRCPVVPESSPLHRLVPPASHRRADFLAELVDVFATLRAPLRLVLDDFQEIVRDEPLAALAAVVQHRPPGLRLVLATRHEPPLRLARLQLLGGLARVEAEDLRFTREETAGLLRAAGAAVGDDRVRHLAERTAGWAAALGWTAVSVRGVDDADEFLGRLDGDDLAFGRFFADEVLSRLPEDTADLLLRISVCDTVTATLAARLSGRPDAGMVLDELERSASLVVRSPADAYRLPPPLRAFLRGELERRHPAGVTALHGIAARWYAGQRRMGEALGHAVAGDDRAAVLALACGHAVRQVLAGEGAEVRRAFSYLGATTVAAHPRLRLASALEHVQCGELAAAAADLDGGADQPPDAQYRLAVRHHALVTGRGAPEIPAPRAPRSSLLDAWEKLDLAWRSVRRGACRHGAAQAKEALRLAHQEGLEHLVLHSRVVLAVATALAGEHHMMRQACVGAFAVARHHGWRASPGLADCHLMLAYDHLVRLEPAAATRELVAAAIVPGAAPLLAPLKTFFGGMTRFDTGDRVAGCELMREARHRLAGQELPRQLGALCAVTEHYAALAEGECVHAAEVLAWAQDRLRGSAECSLLQARAHLAAAEIGPADAALREGRDARVLLPTTPVEACLVETALALAADRRTKALHALDRALALARPNVLVRPFALAEPRVGHLLIDHSGGFGALDRFAQCVRQRVAPPSVPAPRDGLTDRERVVLRRLPSPRSLDEIASDLTVSVNTVKTHVRAIYGKLGVNNRRSAVVVARQHGLT